MKICSKCRKKKSDSEFHLHNKTKDYLNSCCKNCDNFYHFESKLHRCYGITIVQYEMMLKSQNGVCKICGKFETKKIKGTIKRLSVDHCHSTGKIRGLLCTRCNQMLGQASDSPELLRKAAFYLEGQLCARKKSN